jgi:streptogramin lyase
MNTVLYRLLRSCHNAIIMLCIAGCATTAGLIGFGQPTDEKERANACEQQQKVLTPWGSITGTLKARPATSGAQPPASLERVRLISPGAVAAISTSVFIADTAQGLIFKFDRATQTISNFASVPRMGNKVDLYVDRGMSVYLVDQASATTTQFDIDGRVLQRFNSPLNLPKPVALVVDDVNAEIFIADRLRAHVMVFNRTASVNKVIGSRKGMVNPWQSITELALANNQLYIVDQLAHQVHALAPAGGYRYAFGTAELVSPSAIAVDSHDRVFVADTASNTLKIFKGGEYQAEVGARGSAIASDFQSIDSLWIDGDLLYLTDTNSASIKIYKILPPCV